MEVSARIWRQSKVPDRIQPLDMSKDGSWRRRSRRHSQPGKRTVRAGRKRGRLAVWAVSEACARAE